MSKNFTTLPPPWFQSPRGWESVLKALREVAGEPLCKGSKSLGLGKGKLVVAGFKVLALVYRVWVVVRL